MKRSVDENAGYVPVRITSIPAATVSALTQQRSLHQTILRVFTLSTIKFLMVLYAYTVPPSLALQHSPIVHTSPISNTCSTIVLPPFTGFEITSSQAQEVYNFSVPSSGISGLNFCNVSVILTHQGANDSVLVNVWLPLKDWNGRFLGTGGGGFLAGSAVVLPPPVTKGYAAAFTDAGLTLDGKTDPALGHWVLKSDGTLDHELLKNFADRSIHDMAVIGKGVVKAFYGSKPRYNYFAGCSTGGRQGYFAAQKYPEDFDGILANAPAIAMAALTVGDFWPQLVMENSVAPPQCVFEKYQENIIASCDPLDGAKDGLISNPEKCRYDAKKLIGSRVTCPDGDIIITSQHAMVVTKILQGATTVNGKKLFGGLPEGASFAGLANTETVNGTTTPISFFIAETWIKYFVAQDPDYDIEHLTFPQYDQIFKRSVTKFADILGVKNPNLSAFKTRGGKILTWHGLADSLITPELNIQYHIALEHNMGGAKAVDRFNRLFLAPGVDHCGGGYGPLPVDDLGVLVKWVEKGLAPDVLPASMTNDDGVNVTRNLCPWPRFLTYNGAGDVSAASSFSCTY